MLASQIGFFEKLQTCFESHFLQWRRIGSDSNAVERLVNAFERHVVSDKRQMSVVDMNTVCAKYLFDFVYYNSIGCFDAKRVSHEMNIVQVQFRCVQHIRVFYNFVDIDAFRDQFMATVVLGQRGLIQKTALDAFYFGNVAVFSFFLDY